jgi:hypothetical protein
MRPRTRRVASGGDSIEAASEDAALVERAPWFRPAPAALLLLHVKPLGVGAPRWFTLRYGRYSRYLLKLVASGPERSGIAVDAREVAITMGRCFDGRAPRTAVTSAQALPGTVVSRGAHGWRGDWLVNGAGDRLVEIRFEPPMQGHVLMVPVRVRRLRISVDEPQALVAALAGGADD